MKFFYISAAALTVLVLVAYITLIPKSFLGEAFFGGVPSLYNPVFARFFYEQSLIFDGEDGKPEPYIYYQLGRIDFIEGDQKGALEKLNKELEIFPEHLHTHYMLGLVYGYTNREREGIEAFRKYIEYDPNTWAARNDMAWLQFRIGDFEGGLNTIQEAYALQPNNPWVLNTYGVLLMNQGRYEEAVQVLEKGSVIANSLTEEDWGKAYPGNDPRIYATGLKAMQSSFESNLVLSREKNIENEDVHNK